MSSELKRVQFCEDEQSYFQMMEDTKFEKTWDVIQDHSFPALFVPLDPQVARLLMQAHNQFVASQEGGPPYSLADYSGLLDICVLINGDARSRGWLPEQGVLDGAGGIFVRLSTRSPKDSVMLRPSLAEMCRSEFEKLRDFEQADPASTTQSTALHALYRAATAANRCKCAEEAMQLLVESQRIQGDLQHYVSRSGSGSPVPVFNFVVRPFVAFDAENEFRGFVFKRRLTAVTQYNELCYFPSLQLNHDSLLSAMSQSAFALIPSLPPTLDSCVIDFVCVKSATGFCARIVEINPMAEFAGAGLFSFEKDWRVLQGHAPFEFRYHKNAMHVKLAVRQIGSGWKTLLLKANIPNLTL
jgi:hypothetical protein